MLSENINNELKEISDRSEDSKTDEKENELFLIQKILRKGQNI